MSEKSFSIYNNSKLYIYFSSFFFKFNLKDQRLRKQSIQSVDSDMFPMTTEKNVQMEHLRKPPFLNIIRQETTSTESKDTLTPLEISDDQTLVDDGSVEHITDLNFEAVRAKALRRRSMCRRNSETTYDMNRSQTSLNVAGAMSRRQLSLTQSEPDSGNEQGKNRNFHNSIYVT